MMFITSFIDLLTILFTFIVIFILPFILPTIKIFQKRDLITKICISLIFGLFVSISLSYVLALINAFTAINFLITYVVIIIVTNLLIFDYDVDNDHDNEISRRGDVLS